MAIFPSLAGDMPWDRIPSLSPGMELLRPAQVKNETVFLTQVSAAEYYKKEDKTNEEILSTYYSEQ
jgi:hypothetical protein